MSAFSEAQRTGNISDVGKQNAFVAFLFGEKQHIFGKRAGNVIHAFYSEVGDYSVEHADEFFLGEYV